MSDKQVDTLNGLFDENCVFVHMGGSWGKTQELNTIKNGFIWYKKAEIYGASVNIFGNTAILLNDIDLLAVVGGNEEKDIDIRRADANRMVAVCTAQPRELWESDSTTLRNPESALYDPGSNTLYVSSTGSGTVVRFKIEKGRLPSDNSLAPFFETSRPVTSFPGISYNPTLNSPAGSRTSPLYF